MRAAAASSVGRPQRASLCRALCRHAACTSRDLPHTTVLVRLRSAAHAWCVARARPGGERVEAVALRDTGAGAVRGARALSSSAGAWAMDDCR